MDDLVQLPVSNRSNITVLEEQFVVKPDTRVQLSERKSFTRGRFNTLLNPVTRELTVTSTALHWNGTSAVLEALCVTRDVTRIVLIADDIRIEQLLQWKGACVDIYARRLVFRGVGCIDTTPEAYAGAAFSDTRSEHGRPLNDANEIEAADGLDGQAGGDIRLFIAQLDLGDTDKDKVRLKTDGGPGQVGEEGGLLPFKPRKNGPPTKDVVAVVTKSDVLAVFSNADNSTPDLTDVKHWKTAGGLGAEGLNKTWAELTKDSILKGEFIDYSDYKVTDVRVGLAYLQFLQKFYYEVPVPAREGLARRSKVPQEMTFAKAWEKTHKLTDPWTPSNGEDAYPSGRTGRGGRGGSITLTVAPDRPSGWYSCRGGDSNSSPNINGGEAGTPQKYICAAINAVQYAEDPLYFDPLTNNTKGNILLLTDKLETHRIFGTTKPGKGALGRAKGPGEDGTLARADANTWLDARLLRTMADRAREYFGAGQRERAWELIAPYWRACRDLPETVLATDARSSHQAIENLVQNYQANLDLYGNPPGWVPRFSASNYLRTYLADRRFSYRFVAVMEKAIRLMDGLEQANAMLGDLTASTESLIDQLRDELYSAFVRYDVARDLLDEANSTLLNVQQQLSALESDAELTATIKVHDQAIVKAVFDISGAVLKAIPAYQPALAGVGAVVESVGGVVVSSMNTDPEQPFDGWQAVATISGSVEGVLKENAGSFKSQLEGRLRSRYKDQLDPDAADLRTQVEQMRTAIAEGQTEHDAAVIEASAALERDDLLAELLNTDAELTERLAGNRKNREQLLQELKGFNQTLNELAPANSNDIAMEAATRGKQRLLITRAKLYTLLANAQNEGRELEVRIAENTEKRSDFEAPRQALAQRRSRLEAQQEALDKLLPDFEEASAKDKIKKAGDAAGKALEGAQRLAKGAATIATSISSVARMPEADSEEVQALKAKILKGKYGERYAELQDRVDKATATMSEALSELMSCNQGVTTLTADFAGAIQSSIDISRNRLAFARGLDAGLKTSLVAMQRQARQRMDYYLYLFRKAYMYEYCETVGSDVASLNGFIEQADNWLRDSRAALADAREAARGSDALQGLAQLSAMTDTNIEEFGNDTLRHTLSELASKLLQRRQAQGMPRGNTLYFEIDAPRRQALARERRVTLGPVRELIPDAGEFFNNNRLLKVTGISLAKGDLRFRASAAPHSTVRLVFEFGRELVLWDGRRYVMFRIAKSERPLSFGFVANDFTPDSNGEWSGEFKADSGGSVDELFKVVSAEALGQSLSYAEINPSFLSTLSASITLGGSQIEEITHLSLLVGWQAN